MFQDFRLLSVSLSQNVAASSVYDTDRVRESLRVSGFGERLKGLRRGVEQSLYQDFEEDGIILSGGEEQKIAIARAVYKDAPLVIMDEPTAALDPVAEYEIYTRLNEIAGEKTAVFISHRLSSCRFCDVIAVFDKGGIVQWGSHEELVEQEGKYRELWFAQARHYNTVG